MTTARWEHFEHKADIGVRGYGATLQEAFTQAALAMSSVVTELDQIDNRECINIECKAPENDLLFVDWLNEIIYVMATRRMLYCDFKVEIHNHHLQAEICGEAADQKKHQPAVEIKGATFTELKVYQNDVGEWVAQAIVDV
jgi:tRNA nucleotidyltransferase (CCA-adding enzyme)